MTGPQIALTAAVFVMAIAAHVINFFTWRRQRKTRAILDEIDRNDDGRDR